MPELPEVETIKNELLPHIIGHRITDVTLLWEGIVSYPSVEEFRSRLIGQEITGASRRGKYLLLNLSGGEVLIIHLKMSGALLLDPVSTELQRYIRAIIYLDEGKKLCFRDPRKFGRMWLVKDARSVIDKLGPEPLQADFTPEILARLLKNRTAPIKALLADQTFIAGIGNMYADEALFTAKIHPLRPGGSLSEDEVRRLHKAIQKVLRSGIDNLGASVENYFRPNGAIGTAHSEFKVAHRGGERCPVCGTPIQRLPIRNRGSYFCPRCQPLRHRVTTK